MKIHRFKFYNLIYTVDFPVLFLFCCNFLDIISTFLFVSMNSGTESNFILKELISISIWFIPIYLFTSIAVFVPFLSKALRKTVSYTFGMVNLLLGLNNISLVVFNYAFLIDSLGFDTMIILFVLVGLTIFFYFVKKQNMNRTEVLSKFLKLFLFVLFLGLIQAFFAVIPLVATF